MSKESKITLAIVDDHPMVLEGLKSLIQSQENYQIYSFTKGTAFLDFITGNEVDLVLLDIVLSDGSGLDFCKSIKKLSPKTIVIGVSNQAERSIIFQLLQNGASGYILKNADSQEIISCIKEALNGKVVLSKEVQEIMLTQPVYSYELPKITKREKQILQSIAEGNTSAQIAEKLFISLITVETHRRNLLQKFKAKNMIELVRIATENRLM
jgi:DNA-binding NarL/FixJ family response regulator